MTENVFSIPGSIMDSGEWKELELKENEIGSDNLLEEIINTLLLNGIGMISLE